MNRSRKRSIVYAVRDYPLGCGTPSIVVSKIPRLDHDLVAAPRAYGTCLKQEPEFQNSDRHVLVAAPKPKRTCLKRDSGVHECAVAAPTPKGTSLKQEPVFRNSHHGLVVAAPKLKGACFKQETAIRTSDHHVLAASPKPQGACLKQDPELKNSVRDHTVAAPTPQGTCLKQEPAYRNSHHDRVLAASRLKGACSKQEEAFRSSYHDRVHHRDYTVAAPTPKGTCLKQVRNSHHSPVVAAPNLKGTFSKQESELRGTGQHDPTPREQVLDVLRLFKDVFKQLDRDKQARRLGGDLFDATARIDIRTLAVLENMGKQVNTEKRIGLVPGINVGDEFQYKTELRLVGLHFKTMCGIDYMNVGDVKLATSIVASEGYGYCDKFGAGVVVYTGEGGNVMSKEKKTEDQRLVKGNLALANSMRKRSLVRVIRGEERLDHKGKRYVYDGLYLVDKYWLEEEVRGTSVYKFKLCRIPGQLLC